MKKPQSRGSASAPADALAARAGEALRGQKFKDAIELFKQAIRQEPRPEWQSGLAEAYCGRARDLAAKGMFKEAAMVMENTAAADGSVRNPGAYAHWLIRDGQQQKAAAQLLIALTGSGAPPESERAALEELAAALLVSVPQLPPLPRGASAEAQRWRTLAEASRAALASWSDGAQPAVLEAQVEAIALRSPFRPVRVLLKSAVLAARDPARARQMLASIAPESPFQPLRQAIEAALLAEHALDGDAWMRLSAAQQAFVAEAGGLSEAAAQVLNRLSAAMRAGPAALFSFLLKQTDLPRADLRSACLNLLVHVPEREGQFEGTFGALPPLERHRLRALRMEARGDWAAAAQHWLSAAAALQVEAGAGVRAAKLAQGVVFRHLARLAAARPQVAACEDSDTEGASFLAKAYAADPDHVPGLLELIGQYRQAPDGKAWHRLVEVAVARFPDDSQVLQQAVESALARKAFKKAAGFGRRLLAMNAVNPGLRRQMIDLQLAHARKQMRARRPDLAARELASAGEWERADAPSGQLRIARALVTTRTGTPALAVSLLREGVELAGGGVAGWVRATLEAQAMKCTELDDALRQGLTLAQETPPTSAAVLALMAALGKPEGHEARRTVGDLLQSLRDWLLRGAAIAWTPAEFQALADSFVRLELFDVLAAYVRAGQARDPANPEWRFHEIVARTQGSRYMPTIAETEELFEIATAAGRRGDIHTATRIERFLRGTGPAITPRGRAVPAVQDADDDDDFGDMSDVFELLVGRMPKDIAAHVRQVIGEVGREAAVATLMDQLDMDLPKPIMREVCKAMVAKVLQGGGRKAGGTPARVAF